MYCGHTRLSVRGRMPTLLHGPGCNLGEGMPPSCALLGGCAIGAQVALLWQHYGANWGCYGPSLVPVLPQPPGGAQHPLQHPRRYGLPRVNRL